MGNVRTVSFAHDRPAPFSAAERSLIRKLHGLMPAQQLLELLNERVVADGKGEPHTMEQLHAEIGEAIAATPASEHDWSSLRKLLAQARRDGVLAQITRQVIDDFAIVFSLSAAQVLRLQDVLLEAGDGDDE